ncbi:MAG: restriction endonuclease [gamma proteobacterium symbiont of Taylorina sp.]|nr:restriction endonuclease [gamma proteobacterium symbiont of Taylorina sp.]
MNQDEKDIILEKAQVWFRESIAKNHIRNTQILTESSKFDINPFLAVYLSNFLTGDAKPEGIAKALIYPRVLGTSITTSFGTNIQKFTNDVLSSFGSTTSGIDIEFIDQISGNKIYCQLKSGPNTINKDDVETISGHFKKVIQLGRTNGLRITHDDMVVGIIYGDLTNLNAHYKRITKEYDYPVYIGQEFWYRLTGDESFYTDLIHAIGQVASEADFAKDLNDVIKELAKSPEIIQLSK